MCINFNSVLLAVLSNLVASWSKIIFWNTAFYFGELSKVKKNQMEYENMVL